MAFWRIGLMQKANKLHTQEVTLRVAVLEEGGEIEPELPIMPKVLVVPNSKDSLA